MRFLSIFLCAISTVFAQSSIEWNFAGWSTDQLKYETDNKLATGRFRQIPTFTDHYISIRDGNFFQVDNAPRDFLRTNAITIETVVRITDLPDTTNGKEPDIGGVFGFGDQVAKRGIFLGFWGRPTQYMSVAFLGNKIVDIVQRKQAVITDNWLHIITVYAHNYLEFYINGQLLGRKTHDKSPIMYPDHNIFTIGTYYSPNTQVPLCVNADFHMLKLYNFALSNSEIKQRIKWGQKLIHSDFKTAKTILKPKFKIIEKKDSELKTTFRFSALAFLVLGVFLIILSKLIASSQAKNIDNDSISQ